MNRLNQQKNRVAIPLTSEERQQLEEFCQKERRSNQSMAGIIYRKGLDIYQKEQAHQK